MNCSPNKANRQSHQFVVFCLARTGSTTLTRLLNLHSQIRCMDEPFNRDYHPEYARRATDRESLYELIDEIYQTHNGIKHVADPPAANRTNPTQAFDLGLCALGQSLFTDPFQ